MSAIGKLFILLLVIMISKCENIRPRVFYGRDALKDEYPYVVSYVLYQRRSKHPQRACTGSLISSTCVLTASHCLDLSTLPWTMKNMNLDYIHFGDVTAPFNSTRSLRKVLKRVIHPKYIYYENFNQVDNDIGLAFIKTIVMKTFGKLSAVDYTTLIGLPVVFAGYGRYSENIPDSNQPDNKPLQVGEGVISYCPEDDVEWEPVLCVTSKCGPNQSYMSSGDSGGPLLVRNKIVGVHSGSSAMFGIMTPVSIYLDWIRLNMVAEKKLRRIKESEE